MLDVYNFLAPGSSYSSLLKAFKITENKGYFPYDYFNKADALKETKLPPYQAFFSKNKHVLEEYTQWKKSNEKHLCTLTDDQNWGVNKRMKYEVEYLDLDGYKPVPQPPKNSIEIYFDLLKLWKREKMNTFEDFLKHYNNLDVGPFVKGVKKLCEFYKCHNVDVLKSCERVPGAARELLFSSSGAILSCVLKKTAL